MGKESQQKINRLRLAWLGTPEISYADQPLTFRTRKALALLIYLTTEAGTHSREKLTMLFWPESDAARGRGMLRTTLAYLREVMASFETDYLIVEPHTLGFDFQGDFELDLHTLQAALDLIQLQPGPAERGRVISQLQMAANLYRGDFLEGFSLADTPDFDDWVSLQREVWHGRLSTLFDTLSQWQFEAGDLPAGLETATRWRVHDPYGEAAPQRLMQLHFTGDNRAAALQVYEAYSKMLVAEFGGKPAPEIESLAARVRASRPTQQPRARAPQPPTPADLSFVGRTEEFRRLMAAYHAASQGQTQVVILMGEAGIGKTRLAGEFLQWATAQGAEVLPGRAFETGGELPYQPLAQLLRRRLEQEKAPADLLSVTWLAELSRLLPELRDRYPELPQPQPDEATAQGRLLESITRLGQALANRAPLLLFIDDIQWADLASLDALHYAASRWTEHRAPVLLLLCARDSALVEKSHMQQWLTHHYCLAAGDAALHLFAAGDAVAHYETARQLMVAGSAAQVERAVCQRLYTNLGRALELNGQFEQAGAVYEEMETIARQRAAPGLKLTALMAQSTLWSMISQSFDPVKGEALAEQALSLAHELGDAAAEAKILWGLINLHTHSNRLPQAIACGEQALTLARDLDLPEQKAFILNDLGLCYWLSGRLERAREFLGEAGDLWRALNNLPMLADSLSGSAGLAVDSGDYPLALTLSKEAYQISQAIANLWGQSYSKISVGYIYWDRGQPDQAIAVMQECLRLGDLVANYLTPQVSVRADLAAVYGSLGAIEQGLEMIHLALTVAETHMPVFRPYVLTKLAQLHVRQGQFSEAEAAVDQGKKEFNREGAPILFQVIFLAEAELALRQGDYKRALAATDILLATLSHSGLRAHISEVLYLRGQILGAMGQPEAARKTLLEAHAAAEAIGSRRMLWQILFALSRIETDPGEAEHLYQQAREIVKNIADHISHPDLRSSFLSLAEVRAILSV